MVFKFNFRDSGSLMLHVPWYAAGWKVWKLKGAYIVRLLKQVTHPPDRYLMQIQFTYLSHCFIHDIFNYIIGQHASATLHSQLLEDPWTVEKEASFPEIEIMDCGNMFSFNRENVRLKVTSHAQITFFHNGVGLIPYHDWAHTVQAYIN